jgi:hypothetical protein
MALESQLAHRNLSQTALPYKSYVSPTDSDPFFASGSADILTSSRGYFERRPGFATALESSITTFNSPQRIKTWNRWDGTFIVMLSNINGSNQAEVWKFVVGTDSSFVKLFTDTGSATPHDYVVSNNTIYFGNGNTNRKWDPVNGVTNWGITAPAAAPTLSTDPVYCGTASGTNWTNATNAQGTINQTYAVYNNTAQDNLKCTNFGVTVPAGAQITGVIVNVTGHSPDTTTANRQIDVGLTIDGSTLAGTRKTANTLNLGTDTTVQLGGSGDLWGNTSLTTGNVTGSTFGVLIRDSDTTAAELDIDAVSMAVYWTANTGINSQVGWKHQLCYGNSATGHVSSPSPTSQSTGVVSNASVGVNLVASTDAQVNQIRDFRSTDGGGGNYLEISGSPYTNTTQTIYDTTTDAALNNNSLAPIPTYNDPPPAWKAVVYWHGRVWGIDGTTKNRSWFTGLEEINIGVPEESVPSGTSGNQWNFDEQLTGQAALEQVLLEFCAGKIYQITGDTRDTFRRTLLSNKRGTRNHATIATLGSMSAWLDTANQIWATDGSQLNEIGEDIRPDLLSVTPANCASTFHVAGNFHWFVFSTGAKLFVYDMDTDNWMPPWSVAATAIHSGETAAGTYDLLAAIGGKIYKLNTSAFNDAGTTYTWKAITSNFNLVPDFGRRFSALAVGMYDEPSRLGEPSIIGIESNRSNVASSMQILVDDDPTSSSSTWTDITKDTATPEVALKRNQGTVLFQLVWRLIRFTGRRMAVYLTGANADQADKVYTMFLAYEQRR